MGGEWSIFTAPPILGTGVRDNFLDVFVFSSEQYERSSSMNSAPDQTPTVPKRGARVLRWVGMVIGALLTLLFGLVPFVLGVLIQAVLRRCLHPLLVGLIGAALFPAVWWTGWYRITIGDGHVVWVSILVTLYLFFLFFAAGGAFLRSLLPNRFAGPTNS